MSYNVMTSLNW